jgi:hypothetical protein
MKLHKSFHNDKITFTAVSISEKLAEGISGK